MRAFSIFTSWALATLLAGPSVAAAQTVIQPEHAAVVRLNGGGNAAGQGLVEVTAGYQLAVSEVVSFELRVGGGFASLHDQGPEPADRGYFRGAAALSFRYRIENGPARLGFFLEPGVSATEISGYLVPQFGLELEVGQQAGFSDGAAGGVLLQAWAAPWFPLTEQREAPVFFGLGVGGYLGAGRRVVLPPHTDLRDQLRDFVAHALDDVIAPGSAPTAQCDALFREDWEAVQQGRECAAFVAPVPAGQCAVWVAVAPENHDIDLRVDLQSANGTLRAHDYAQDNWPVVVACNGDDQARDVVVAGRFDGSGQTRAYIARYPGQLPVRGQTLPEACSESSTGDCCLAHLGGEEGVAVQVPARRRLAVTVPGFAPTGGIALGPAQTDPSASLEAASGPNSLGWRGKGHWSPATGEATTVRLVSPVFGTPALVCRVAAQPAQPQPRATSDGPSFDDLRGDLVEAVGSDAVEECSGSFSQEWSAVEGACAPLVESLSPRGCVEWRGHAADGADIDLRIWHSADSYEEASDRAEDVAGDNWPIVRLCNATDAAVDVRVEGRVWGASAASAMLLRGLVTGSTPEAAPSDNGDQGGN